MYNGGIDYPLWQSLFASNAFRLATFLFMLALLWHAWIGMRDIWMDYIKPTALRLTLEMVVRSACSSATPAGRSRSCGV